MKRLIALLALLVALVVLSGCWIDDVVILTLSVPDSAYPPCEVTLIALGVDGGQFTFTVEGKTYTQTSKTLVVTVNELPTEVSVTWFDGNDSQTATETIWLRNTGPVPGQLVLNFITNLWTLHARERYVVTYPHAYDPEGGPIKMIDAIVEWGTHGKLAVFCPPYTGAKPPKPDVYHVRMPSGEMVYNAFMFLQGWPVHIEASSGLPYTPPSQSNIDNYPHASATCGPKWPTDTRAGCDVTIMTTWEDEQGAKTIDVQTIPANPYIGCGTVQTPSATCP